MRWPKPSGPRPVRSRGGCLLPWRRVTSAEETGGAPPARGWAAFGPAGGTGGAGGKAGDRGSAGNPTPPAPGPGGAGLWDLHRLYFPRADELEYMNIDEGLAAEVAGALRGRGYDPGEGTGYDETLKRALFDYVGTENLEERWSEDPVIEV